MDRVLADCEIEDKVPDPRQLFPNDDLGTNDAGLGDIDAADSPSNADGDLAESEHDIAADENDMMADGEVDEDERSLAGRTPARRPAAMPTSAEAVYGEADGPANDEQRDVHAGSGVR